MKITHNPHENEYQSFISHIYQSEPDLLADLEQSLSSRRNEGIYLVMDTEGTPITLASMHSSAYHPFCIYTRLAYEPGISSGRLTDIVNYLKDAAPRPLFFLLDKRSSRLQSTLVAAGFEMIRKTDIIRIKPRSGQIDLHEGFMDVRELNEAGRASLVSLCARLYRETHTANPPADLTFDLWEELVFDEMLEAYSYAALRHGRVIGYSLIYEDGSNWELGWNGVESMDDLPLLDAMLGLQLQKAAKQGVGYIEKEVDTTDPYALHIALTAEFEVAETWVSYLEKQEEQHANYH